MSELPPGFDALRPYLPPLPVPPPNTFAATAQQMPPPIGPGRGRRFTTAPRQRSLPLQLCLSPLVEIPGHDLDNAIALRLIMLPLIQSNLDHSIPSAAVTGHPSSLDEPLEEESRVKIVELFSCPSSPFAESVSNAASSLLALQNDSSATSPPAASVELTTPVVSNEPTTLVIIVYQEEQFESAPIHLPLVPIQ